MDHTQLAPEVLQACVPLGCHYVQQLTASDPGNRARIAGYGGGVGGGVGGAVGGVGGWGSSMDMVRKGCGMASGAHTPETTRAHGASHASALLSVRPSMGAGECRLEVN